MRRGISVDVSAADRARLEAVVADRKVVHAILDNYATHKHPKVPAWLQRHPRFVLPLHANLGILV